MKEVKLEYASGWKLVFTDLKASGTEILLFLTEPICAELLKTSRMKVSADTDSNACTIRLIVTRETADYLYELAKNLLKTSRRAPLPGPVGANGAQV